MQALSTVELSRAIAGFLTTLEMNSLSVKIVQTEIKHITEHCDISYYGAGCDLQTYYLM